MTLSRRFTIMLLNIFQLVAIHLYFELEPIFQTFFPVFQHGSLELKVEVANIITFLRSFDLFKANIEANIGQVER